jgi:hypothetical protein
MITKERQQTIKGASAMVQYARYFKTEAPQNRPSGVVYKGEHCCLFYTGGKYGNYYLAKSDGGIYNHLYTSDNSDLGLTNGLAICKSLDLYDKDEVKKLFYPQKKSGFITGYFSAIASKIKKFHWNEKTAISWIIDYNEQILEKRSSLDVGEHFYFI